MHSVDVPPSGGSPAPWAGTVAKPPPKKRVPVLPFAIGGVLLACVVVAGGLYFAVLAGRRRIVTTAGPSMATASATAPIAPPSVTASVTSDPPSMSVNALPMASATGPKPKGSGRVTIDAAPQWCNVTIDGHLVGPTPLANYELSAGSHVVRCETSGGLARTFPVQIYEGSTTRHKFTTSP
jgi:hypothetical protein